MTLILSVALVLTIVGLLICRRMILHRNAMIHQAKVAYIKAIADYIGTERELRQTRQLLRLRSNALGRVVAQRVALSDTVTNMTESIHQLEDLVESYERHMVQTSRALPTQQGLRLVENVEVNDLLTESAWTAADDVPIAYVLADQN